MRNTMRGKRFYNDKGELHGPFQDYWTNGLPWETSHYVNGFPMGYSELSSWHDWHDSNKKEIFYFCR